jgi:hypothetical protein
MLLLCQRAITYHGSGLESVVSGYTWYMAAAFRVFMHYQTWVVRQGEVRLVDPPYDEWRWTFFPLPWNWYGEKERMEERRIGGATDGVQLLLWEVLPDTEYPYYIPAPYTVIQSNDFSVSETDYVVSHPDVATQLRPPYQASH